MTAVRPYSSRSISIAVAVNLLTYLIGLVAFLSVAREVHLPFVLLFVGLVSLSVYLTLSRHTVINRWTLNALSLGVIIFAVYRFNLDELITQMVEALLVLLCIKFLEDRKVRDYMQIYAISLLMVAGSGLLSLGMLFLVNFFALVFLLTVASILLSYYAQDGRMELGAGVMGKIVRNALIIPVLAIPLTAFMFAILPRTNYPLFNFLNQKEKAHTGFSDYVTLGTVSSIQEDSSAAFRVTMPRIDESALYWRGIVLDYFDGTRWSSSGHKMIPSPGRDHNESVIQTIYLEPREGKNLIALDRPITVSLRNARQIDDGAFVSPLNLSGRTRYTARSSLSHQFPDKEIDMGRYLQTPEDISAPILALARKLGEGRSGTERVRAAYNYLNDGTFRYSLDNLPVSNDPVTTFLFQTKYGNCEYFASTYAMLLRLQGIPARLVGGYKGGYYNGVGGYYLVPEKNAHVWVEVYLRDRGWLRMDPTPAAMERFASLRGESALMKVGLFLDTMNYYWYAFVINYNLERQLSFVRTVKGAFKKSRFDLAFLKDGVKHLKYLGLVILAGMLFFLLRGLHLRRSSMEERLLASFLRRMQKSGYPKKPSQGLEEFVSTVRDERAKNAALLFVKEFEALYFRDRPISPEQTKRLTRMIRSI